MIKYLKITMNCRCGKDHTDNKEEVIKNKKHGINILNYLLFFAQRYNLIKDADIRKVIDCIFLFIPKHKDKINKKLVATVNKFTINSDTYQYLAKKFELDNAEKNEKKGRGNKKYLSEIKTVNVTDEMREQINKITDKWFEDDMFPHVNAIYSSEFEKRKMKFYLLCKMTAVYLLTLVRERTPDSRDKWANKRWNLISRMMEQLFKAILRKITYNASRSIKKTEEVFKTLAFESVVSKMIGDREKEITKTFQSSFSTADWGVSQTNYTKQNATQIWKSDNIVSAVSHLLRGDVNVSSQAKLKEMRVPQADQDKMICVSELVEGKKLGITKNLCVAAMVVPDEDDTLLVSVMVPYATSEPVRNGTLLLINLKPLGWCIGPDGIPDDGIHAYNKLRDLKLMGQPYYYMTVILDPTEKIVSAHTDAGRIMRPVQIVGLNGKLESENKSLVGADFTTLIENRCIEYVCSWESTYSRIANTKDDLNTYNQHKTVSKNNYQLILSKYNTGLTSNSSSEEILKFLSQSILTSDIKSEIRGYKNLYDEAMREKPFKYCDIDPVQLYSIAGAVIPKPESSQAPRTSTQTKMAQQAQGKPSVNYARRTGEKFKSLVNNTQPLFYNPVGDVIGLGEFGHGESMIVELTADVSTEEDSFKLNRAARDFGKLRTVTYHPFEYIHKEGDSEELQRPILNEGENEQIYHAINDNGLPSIGAYLLPGQCVIGKVERQTVEDNNGRPITKLINKSMVVPIGTEGYVDNVTVVYEAKVKKIINVVLRSYRIPLEGDKLELRYGQKGTVGTFDSPENLSFTANGVTPSMIVNLHSVAARMTGGFLLEMIYGKGSVLNGMRYDATAFRTLDMDEVRNVLRKYGYNPKGTQVVYDGKTGMEKVNESFMGPMYVARLKHDVLDKMQGRHYGQTSILTREPTKGKTVEGGLKFGEMERDTLISHGASKLLLERLIKLSNPHRVLICNQCNMIAGRSTRDRFECGKCLTTTNFATSVIPYRLLLIQYYLAPTGQIFGLEVAEKIYEQLIQDLGEEVEAIEINPEHIYEQEQIYEEEEEQEEEESDYEDDIQVYDD
jgi:DNA-directed RNA polymerase II subunit RPB2